MKTLHNPAVGSPHGTPEQGKPREVLVAARAFEAVAAGDSLLVKGSLGSRMAVIVEALLALGEPAPQADNGAKAANGQ